MVLVALVLFAGLVIGLYKLIAALFGVTCANVATSVAGFVFAPFTAEIRKLLDRFVLWLQRYRLLARLTETLGRLLAPLKRAMPAVEFFDLSLLLGSSVILNLAVYNTFTAVVQDLEAKGFLSFDHDRIGFIHLQDYMGGFIFAPSLLMVCIVYGFYRGFRDGRAALLRIVLAVFLGLLMPALLLALARGGFVGLDNYKLLAKANHGLPVGALWVVPATMASLVLLLILALTVLTYASYLFGKFAALPGKRGLLR